MNQFKKFILLPLAGTQLASVAAMAQSAPASGVYSGSVIVEKGIELSCDIEIDINTNLSTVNISFYPPGSLEDPRCSSFNFYDSYHYYTYVSGLFTIHNTYLNTITIGDCEGDIDMEWTGTEFIIETILPTATSATPDCTIDGTAS